MKRRIKEKILATRKTRKKLQIKNTASYSRDFSQTQIKKDILLCQKERK